MICTYIYMYDDDDYYYCYYYCYYYYCYYYCYYM